jgi:hypothetical protein
MSIIKTKRRLGLKGRSAWLNGVLADRFSRLGYSYTAADYSPDQYSSASSPFFADNPVAAVSALSPPANPYGYGTSSVPGSISPQDAALLSTAITTAGKVGTQAIIGTPSLTYNPATGQYTATGGATIPSSLSISSAISSYLPLILLGGGLLLLVSAMGKR